MSFPDIHLEAINRQAASLFNRSSINPEPVNLFIEDLMAKNAECDDAIKSIKQQLAARGDEDKTWVTSAVIAMRGYKRQRASVQGFLKTARQLLQTIEFSIQEQSRITRQAKAIQDHEAQRQETHRQRLERITQANDETVKWNVEFRKVLRAQLGEQRVNELIDMTNARMGITKESNT